MLTALITGSGKNIGRSVALGLAKDGFNVVVNGSTDQSAVDETVAASHALGVEALGVIADIGETEGLDQLISTAKDRFGGIDVLVNNAAIRPSVDFLEMTEADWNRVRAVNLDAAFYLCRAFLPNMVERGYGRIVNFTGMHAMRGYIGRAHVSATKHAVLGLTKSLGREFADRGITANAISPGPIRGSYETEMHDNIQATVAQVPAGRTGTPDEVTSLVRLLVSEEGGYINGQMLQINGGAQT